MVSGWNERFSFMNLRLDGGAADEDGISSSGSLERLRRVGLEIPRLAADMLGRRGELQCING